jgi:REP element-mobilizing transposase RayT
MARLPRVVIVDVPHHVTQRGNARQVILASDAERVTYLELLREYSQLYSLSLLGYCLMSNHVHLIAIPQTAQALGQSLKQAHGRYAAYWNARNPGDRRDVHHLTRLHEVIGPTTFPQRLCDNRPCAQPAPSSIIVPADASTHRERPKNVPKVSPLFDVFCL